LKSSSLNELTQQQKINLSELFKSCKGQHFNALWHNTFEWQLHSEALIFTQKRQLFFELVRYYMDASLIRFDNFILDYTKPELWEQGSFGYQTVKWSSSENQYPDTDEVLAYLETGFPKNEAEFKLESDRYFYNYCPFVYWLDKETGDWWAS